MNSRGHYILALSTAMAVLASPLSAAAFQPQPTSSISVPAGSSSSSRRVCTEIRPTGSRFTRRICRTQAEVEADRQAQQEAAREFQHEGFVSPGDTAAGSNGLGGPN